MENVRFPQNAGNRPRLYGVINQNTTRGMSTFVFFHFKKHVPVSSVNVVPYMMPIHFIQNPCLPSA